MITELNYELNYKTFRTIVRTKTIFFQSEKLTFDQKSELFDQQSRLLVKKWTFRLKNRFFGQKIHLNLTI